MNTPETIMSLVGVVLILSVMAVYLDNNEDML